MREKAQGQYIVDEQGRRTAILLPIEEYEELLQDIHDLSVIAERRDEPTVGQEELKKTLKQDGLLGDSLEALRSSRPPEDRQVRHSEDSGKG